MKSQRPNTLMKVSAIAIFFALHVSTAIAAENTNDLQMLESAENVEFVSQEIAKAYFYKQQGVRPDQAAKDLQEGISLLQKDILILEKGLKKGDKEERNIVTFLSYMRDELLSTLAKPYSMENGALILDYGESLLEGAEFISSKHVHKDNPEETILSKINHSIFLLERINKFYIANKSGFKDYNNVVQLKQAVQDFEKNLEKINVYKKYPENVQVSVKKINEFWPVAKEFYIDVQKGALPVIVLASTEKLETELKVIAHYHHKAAGGK